VRVYAVEFKLKGGIMAGAPRTNKASVAKTFRFSPALVEDMERVLYLTTKGGKPKYPSMTRLIAVAVDKLIRNERRGLESAGVVWEHLKPGLKQNISKKEK